MTRSAFCAACGAPTSSGEQRFCRHCGASLTVDGPVARQPPERLGPYRLDAVIGEGGMGVVYRGWDERLERRVAVKLLRDDLAADPEFRRRFIHESRAAASLEHPNILPVFDAGEVDGALYIATRLVDGEDLRSIVAREGTLTVSRALAIAAQIGAALDHAHAHGIVHRDVKPGNVLIVPSRQGDAEHAYLIDFGIVKRVDATVADVTLAGRFMGTPEYAAPEQIRGDAVAGSADQYALAAVLFQCLTGSSPSAAAGSQAHVHRTPPSVTSLRPDVPAALDAAVLRALDEDPSRRFTNCRDLLTAARAQAAPSAAAVPGDATVADVRRDRPAPPEAETARARTSRRPGSALWVAAAATIVAIALAATAIATDFRFGGAPSSEQHAGTTTTTVPATPKVKTVIQTTPAVTTTVTTPTATEPETTTTTPPPDDGPAPLDVASLTLSPHAALGYTASLPARWSVGKDDEPQPTPAGVTRRRTTATDRARGVSVVIDHLTGFDHPPAENRSTLQAAYSARFKGYSYVSEADYPLADRPTYEWRYRVQDGGGEIHRVDLLFRDGGHDFGVLATGRVDFDDLAVIARSVAETVTPTRAATTAATRVRDPRLPVAGRYSGTGAQHLAGADNHGVQIVMTLGGDAAIAYPRLHCTARLVADGFDGGRRVYHERFTSGTCDDAGTWRVLKLSDDRISARWSSPGDPYTVSATLDR